MHGIVLYHLEQRCRIICAAVAGIAAVATATRAAMRTRPSGSPETSAPMAAATTRARGLGTRVLPYVLTGVALVVLGAVFTAVWGILDHSYDPDGPRAFVQFLFRLLDPIGAIGLALLVLAWLERRVALLLFTFGYLVVALAPINFGWGVGWGPLWGRAPQLVIDGGVLLLGSAGFALAQRLRRPR